MRACREREVERESAGRGDGEKDRQTTREQDTADTKKQERETDER